MAKTPKVQALVISDAEIAARESFGVEVFSCRGGCRSHSVMVDERELCFDCAREVDQDDDPPGFGEPTQQWNTRNIAAEN